jgi:hypothetical protein
MKDIVYKLDYHVSEKTQARTYWKVQTIDNEIVTIDEAYLIKEIIDYLYSTYDSKRTHWFKYIKVLKPSKIRGFIRVRISNRGNMSQTFFTLEEMDKHFRASREEIELLKDLTSIE